MLLPLPLPLPLLLLLLLLQACCCCCLNKHRTQPTFASGVPGFTSAICSVAASQLLLHHNMAATL
jgi:hypothetical protein